MRATIFIGSLKPDHEDSNTVQASALVNTELEKYGVQVKQRYLRKRRIAPGVEFDTGDSWDQAQIYYEDVAKSDIIILATPVWWGIHSSLVQALMERVGAYDDAYIQSGKSPLYNKVFGCIITASNDGFQHTQGILYTFASNLGMTIPPESYVSWGTVVGAEAAPVDNAQTVNQVKIMSRNLFLWGKMIRDLDLGNLALGIRPGRVGLLSTDELAGSEKSS
jgi:multimeric flavodoxin WrbA